MSARIMLPLALIRLRAMIRELPHNADENFRAGADEVGTVHLACA